MLINQRVSSYFIFQVNKWRGKNLNVRKCVDLSVKSETFILWSKQWERNKIKMDFL